MRQACRRHELGPQDWAGPWTKSEIFKPGAACHSRVMLQPVISPRQWAEPVPDPFTGLVMYNILRLESQHYLFRKLLIVIL